MFRIVERPRPCSYLPHQRASLEITFDSRLTPHAYGELLRRGYRRFGRQVFRPVCARCSACISLRVLAAEYQLNAGDRRVLRQNKEIHCQLAPATLTADHVELYNRYQAFMHLERGWALQSHDALSYFEGFVAGPPLIGFEWRYYQAGKLVGVSLMDQAPGAVSLVYFFYDPDWRPLSPGRFSILNQLLFARQQHIPHAYLGYWVAACQSLSYKGRYHPAETLDAYVDLAAEPNWSRRESL